MQSAFQPSGQFADFLASRLAFLLVSLSASLLDSRLSCWPSRQPGNFLSGRKAGWPKVLLTGLLAFLLAGCLSGKVAGKSPR